MKYCWEDILPEKEKQAYAAGGMGENLVGFGKKPAILVVDMATAFVRAGYGLGEGAPGEEAAKYIQKLLAAGREKGVPIFYTTFKWKPNWVERGWWKRTPQVLEALQRPDAYDIAEELAPMPDEPVVVKAYPSAFFGTSLQTMLTINNVDTTIITGMVTSGCVFTSAVDAFSYGHRVIIPQECVADRSEISHKVSLMNVHMKYGDVVSLEKVLNYIKSLE